MANPKVFLDGRGCFVIEHYLLEKTLPPRRQTGSINGQAPCLARREATLAWLTVFHSLDEFF